MVRTEIRYICRRGAAFLASLFVCVASGRGMMTVVAQTDDATHSAYMSAAAVLDYSAEGSEGEGVPMGDVVAGLVGSLSEAERSYLNIHSAYAFRISKDIPAESYHVQSDGDNIWALADSYRYTTADAVTVTWFPLYATLPVTGEIASFTWSEPDGAYRAIWSGAGNSETVEIAYMAAPALPEDVAVALVNEAWEEAVSLDAVLDAYAVALADWTAQDVAYDAYLDALAAWEEASEAYRIYCEAYHTWVAWWADYHDKKAAVDAYDAQMTAYETWVQYLADKAAYDEYMESVSADAALKEAYERDVIAANAHLRLLSLIYETSNISGYSFNGVLRSGVANYVIDNKNKLLNIPGVDKDDVNGAIEATYRLRFMLDNYEACTTDAERYVFYMTNRADMVAQMSALYDCMTGLGSVEKVMIEIKAQDGEDAFVQFLGRTYVHMSLLSDEMTLDGDAIIFERSLHELIEDDLMLDDSNTAAPLDDGYPVPPQLGDIEPVPYPGEAPPEAEMPAPVAPIPDTANAPARPAEVSDPGEAPIGVPSPGDAPCAPILSDIQTDLHHAYEGGIVTERTADDLIDGRTRLIHTVIVSVSVSEFTTTAPEPTGEPETEAELDMTVPSETTAFPETITSSDTMISGMTSGITSMTSVDREPVTLPLVESPEVSWYARLIGCMGLPVVAMLTGGILGLLTAGVAVWATRLRDKKKK